MKRGYLYLIVTFFLYGSIYVANKFVLGSVPPFTLLFLRQAIAAIVLAALALKKGLMHVEKKHWIYFLALGIVGYFSSVGLQTVATSLMDASVSALLNSMNPVFISLFAVLLLRERLTCNKVVGILCSLVGVCIVIGIQDNGISFLGIIFSITSVLLWSLISVLVRKISAYYPSEQITLIGFLISLPFCFIASEIELQVKTATFSTQTVLAILYIAIFCTACGYLLWNRSLTLLDASVCSLFYPLQPLFAAILGIILLGESISINFIVGGLFISAGVLIGLLEKKHNT
ncbi:MAG: DMT family transporter [Oscillospiraceae bacterium]